MGVVGVGGWRWMEGVEVDGGGRGEGEAILHIMNACCSLFLIAWDEGWEGGEGKKGGTNLDQYLL